MENNRIRVNDNLQPIYEEEYKNMIKCLKVSYQDLTMLHRNVFGKKFVTAHDLLNEIYDDISNMIDDLIEAGLSLDIYEPSIEESINYKKPLEVKFRTVEETYIETKSILQTIYNLMKIVNANIEDDIKAKIEEYQYKIRIWCFYKIEMILKEVNI